MTLAGGVWQGVDVPLAHDLSPGGCEVARTKPWKMLPSTLDETGLDISGRCEKTVLRLFGRGDVCAATCCCCILANLLAASAASRSSKYCAGMVSTGNIVAVLIEGRASRGCLASLGVEGLRKLAWLQWMWMRLG